MKAKLSACLSLSVLFLAVAVPFSSAQVDAARLKALNTRLQQQLKTYNRFPASLRMAMDGTSNAAHAAVAFQNMLPALAKPMSRPALAARVQAQMTAVAASTSGVSTVSDSSTDLDLSGFAGFTQSETSTAWCGNSVVVGFNDSGSFLQTLVFGTGGLSFSGAAFSTNRGATFKDVGAMPPGANLNNFLEGDPQVGCTSPSNFYYAQLFATSDSAGNPISSLALSTSNDGGATWSDPVAALNKDGFSHQIDKEWLSVDPTNPKRLYLSYTDFDFTFNNPACPNDARTAIEVVSSGNAGATWSQPTVIDTICGFTDALQGSHVVVGSDGKINVAWAHFTNFPIGARELRFTSYVHGKKPKGYTVVDGIVGGGDTFYLQGSFRDFLGIDMNIDRSGGPTDGTIYVTWDDGRDKSIPDIFGISGAYAFDDVLLRFSTDGGATWGFAPIKVNSDLQPRIGYGHDHYQPGIAIDATGKVGACWYDRRNDASNFGIERFCGTTTNGLTWTNSKVAVPSFGPEHGIDGLINSVYMGDYDGLASDYLKTNPGFIGAFEVMSAKANPDIKAFSFK
jgi:hypothetical protein